MPSARELHIEDQSVHMLAVRYRVYRDCLRRQLGVQSDVDISPDHLNNFQLARIKWGVRKDSTHSVLTKAPFVLALVYHPTPRFVLDMAADDRQPNKKIDYLD